jgi:hypothetical protein
LPGSAGAAISADGVVLKRFNLNPLDLADLALERDKATEPPSHRVAHYASVTLSLCGIFFRFGQVGFHSSHGRPGLPKCP